ncbi:sterol desaturase family protein [Ralstonia mannitolilytica]|uniref:sterol desaturase family protein n=1 Tax=Ralstonia mannitolilytica TaxID=105219 RepID=UPI000CED9068|nr:sterol desaturase family protein [Ralstonia mannitolilytica]MBU9577410.1 sterol desaturase family protein [Ralstonia mannitolilytica]
MSAFALPLALMLGCVLLELAALKWWRGQPLPWRDVILNLNSGHVLMWLCRGVEVAGFTWLYAHASLHWVDGWHPVAGWAFAFVAWDLGFYWLHRMHHKLGFLWAIHAVHHEGEHFNLSLGVRNAWLSSLTSLPFFVPLALLGVTPEMFVAVSGLHYSVQFYNHCGLVGRSGVLDRFMVTPANHRVHHGCNPEYIDRNFGGTLLLWDKLFGTYQRALADVPIRYGVHKPTHSDNPFWANVVPALQWLGLRTPHLQRDTRTTPAGWIATGGVLLFGVVIDYVRTDGLWPGHWQAVWFALILLLTLALGGLSDGRGWGRWLWPLLALALPVLMIGICGAGDALSDTLAVALGLHGLACGLWHALRTESPLSSSPHAESR